MAEIPATPFNIVWYAFPLTNIIRSWMLTECRCRGWQHLISPAAHVLSNRLGDAYSCYHAWYVGTLEAKCIGLSADNVW
jgi:hypothetical protein